jgi:uncharacterized protein (DUF1501 family)
MALGGAVFTSSVRSLGLINALAQSGKGGDDAAPDYKALVCIFLFGGNDCNNMVIPYNGYANYSTQRGVRFHKAACCRYRLQAKAALSTDFIPASRRRWRLQLR